MKLPFRQPHAPPESSSHHCILTTVTYLHPEELLTPKAVNSHLPKTHSSHLHSWRTLNHSWAVWGLNRHSGGTIPVSGHHCFWQGVGGFLPQLSLGESFFSDWDVDFHFNLQKLECAVSSWGSPCACPVESALHCFLLFKWTWEISWRLELEVFFCSSSSETSIACVIDLTTACTRPWAFALSLLHFLLGC